MYSQTEQFEEQQGSRGDLIIGLKFECEGRGKGTLHVLVKEAKNLVATKPNGLADVFCKSYLLPERGRLAKQKTGVSRRTLSPRWEHTFTYRGLAPAELAGRALELSLWDRDRLASNDFMGAVRLSLGTGTYMGANVNWMDSVGKEVTLWQTMMQRPNFWVEGSLPLRPQLNN
ncbi:Synaptotagmin-like protein 4 [Papilio machaon]|uniref:Synaptotagmin-like protein 4 n=1 Tax=Papilio machaon TaxID=76193 RepID=A0A194RND7_PAPMA|nr:Synaptotagmin-like protein 4 [Papilio machaon]